MVATLWNSRMGDGSSVVGGAYIMDRRQWLTVAGAQMGGLCLASRLLADDTNFNERSVEPRIHREDKADIWTLHFRFKDPRIITADVPGRGKKVIWYMWYQ